MTIPTAYAAERQDGSAATTWPLRALSVTAGVGLLLMTALAVVGNFVALEGLVTSGDAARTAGDVTAAEGLFRLGIASFVGVIALDVVVAWALYGVFRPVSRSLSALAAALRLVYSGVFLVAVGQLLGALRLFSDGSARTALGAEPANAQAMASLSAFSDIWDLGLLLFGLHLLVIGYLAYRSGYLPRLLGVLVVLAGLGYLVDSLAAVLVPGPWTAVSTFTFLGEFLLALWLLIRARHLAGQQSLL